MALRIFAVLAGVAIVAAAIGSAVKTVVLPRASASRITRSVFVLLRGLFRVIARPSMRFERRDRILGAYAPLGLIATLAAWLALVLAGFTLIFWGTDHEGWRASFDLSGSSLFTLGFTRPEGLGSTALIFVEAAIGLFLLALLITYLPTIYAAFSRREVGITALEVRAGSPPSAREMIWRYWQLGRLPEIHEVWAEWERWFVDVENPTRRIPPWRSSARRIRPLVDHRCRRGARRGSAHPVLGGHPPRRQAEFCIRSGYLCLRAIANYFQITHDPDPRPDDPISIDRHEWDEVIAGLEEAGVPLQADRDQAWRDFAGWRVNYDRVLISLAALTEAPVALWSSDRGIVPMRPPVFGRR